MAKSWLINNYDQANFLGVTSKKLVQKKKQTDLNHDARSIRTGPPSGQ